MIWLLDQLNFKEVNHTIRNSYSTWVKFTFILLCDSLILICMECWSLSMKLCLHCSQKFLSNSWLHHALLCICNYLEFCSAIFCPCNSHKLQRKPRATLTGLLRISTRQVWVMSLKFIVLNNYMKITYNTDVIWIS